MRKLITLFIIVSALACDAQGIKERFDAYMNELNKTEMKSDAIHGLHKVPDSIIVKSQAVEIGQLKAYIDELKHNGSNKIMQDVITKRNQTIKVLNSKVDSLHKKVNTLLYENYNSIPHENLSEELKAIFTKD